MDHDLANKVSKCLTKWGIDRKIFSITLDNFRANDRMQQILGEQLNFQNILNSIVQEGLKAAELELSMKRENIKYVKGSEARKRAFKECVVQVRGIDTKVGLRLDVPT